jgi:YfiH family protein
MKDPFYWKQQGALKLLVSKPLEGAGFVNGFSTRVGGVSPFPEGDLNLAGFGEDTNKNIAENRRRFLEFFGNGYRISTVWQVHGNDLHRVRTAEEAGDSEDKADAVISDLPEVLAGVKTADCVPVLIGDPLTGAYAAVHAGWRGTLDRIVEKAVEALKTDYGSDPATLVAAIGPAASGRCYEVGPEVVEAFEAEFSTSGKLFSPTSGGHALVDLHLANRQQLLAAGVREAGVSLAPFCTMERTDLFFSYRIEKKSLGKTGRLLSVVGRAS